ncbi:hypothetical protein LJC46_09000 [Desulfovibrio sp. OttesenSCG-928-G15]|nr:hypothetical protein [Desulfovibrio sp. OttesenSCG-928-G15]
MKQSMQLSTAAYTRGLISILMLLVLAGGMLLPATNTEAANKPKWLHTKILKWSIKKNAKATDNSKGGYYELHLEIRHTNTSADKVVTTLYDKTGSFILSGGVEVGSTLRAEVSAPLRSTKVNRVSLDPGQGITLTYTLSINKNHSTEWWRKINEAISQKLFKIKSWTYDLKVKSREI